MAFTAPYFATLPARFVVLDTGRAEVGLRNRRKVRNHLGTVHAIAMANLCELAAGTMMEVTVPAGIRWIPRGMRIRYLAKATTDLVAVATLPDIDWGHDQDVACSVEVRDTRGTVVLDGDILMYVSRRPADQPALPAI